MKRKTVLLSVLLLVGVSIVGFAGWLVYQGIAVSLDAERTHQAYMRVLDATYEYVAEQHRWPDSWDRLAPSLQKYFPGADGMQNVARRVRVDFSLSLAQVATMDIDRFTAIEPTLPHYGINEGAIAALRELARLYGADEAKHVDPATGASANQK